MYDGVPTTWVSPVACSIAFATPRSATSSRSPAVPAAAEQQVLRLDVAVHDAVLVQHRQPGAGLGDQVATRAGGRGSPGSTQRGERAEVGVRHHEVGRAVDLADVVDAHDVVGVGLPQDPGLLEEPLPHVEPLRPVLGEGLHRDVGAQLGVVVEPDGREPADPEPVHPLETAETFREGHAGYGARQ